MHDLSHFMEGLLQRFTCWFNRTHARLWVGKVSKGYRILLLEAGEEKFAEVTNAVGEREVKVVRGSWGSRWFTGKSSFSRYGNCLVSTCTG